MVSEPDLYSTMRSIQTLYLQLRTVFSIVVLGILVPTLIGAIAYWVAAYSGYRALRDKYAITHQQTEQVFTNERAELTTQLSSISGELAALRAEDQFKRNEDLQAEIKSLEDAYKQSVIVYEALLKLSEDDSKVQTFESSYSAILTALSKREYQLAIGASSNLKKAVDTRLAELTAAGSNPGLTAPVNNAAPNSGYRRQTVETDVGSFVVDIIAADLNSTRVVVETASNSDCGNGCPVDSLANFVAKAGGFAGINGPYFCPAEYPSCEGKTNSFDTLLMNKQKTYFNSANNVYSAVPAVIFSGNSARFVGASQEWGRDTGVDAVIAAQPLLLQNGDIRFGGDGDPKKGSRGSRSFIGAQGSTVYIGVVRSATVAEVAWVLKKIGLQHGINLDSGGSTALYSAGRYVAGPGRNTPFGIVLMRK